MANIEQTDFLKSYTREKHLESLNYKLASKIISSEKITKIYSKSWGENWVDNDELYVPMSLLLDAYYCLPERIDMAFTFLWKSTNSLYTYYGIKNIPKDRLSEKAKIDLIVKDIASNLNKKFDFEDKRYSIKNIVEDFVQHIPLKPLKFISNYLLKGIAIESKGIDVKYNSSSFFTFQKHFPTLFQDIECTYGEAFKKNCSPIISPGKPWVNLQIKDVEKSRKIVHNLSLKIQELLIKKSVKITDSKGEKEYTLKLKNDKEYINFLFRIFLYAIRNNSVHGNKASRFNSMFANEESINASKFIFLLGHLFLSLLMYLNGQLEIEDLKVNIQNTSLYS